MAAGVDGTLSWQEDLGISFHGPGIALFAAYVRNGFTEQAANICLVTCSVQKGNMYAVQVTCPPSYCVDKLEKESASILGGYICPSELQKIVSRPPEGQGDVQSEEAALQVESQRSQPLRR